MNLQALCTAYSYYSHKTLLWFLNLFPEYRSALQELKDAKLIFRRGDEIIKDLMAQRGMFDRVDAENHSLHEQLKASKEEVSLLHNKVKEISHKLAELLFQEPNGGFKL